MLFDDGKEPGALRTIGEVATALGIRQHVLRYWEEQFPMLRPVKRSGGRRYYRPDDVALVARIDRLVHKEGYTLRGARAVIAGDPKGERTKREDEVSPVPTPTPTPAQVARAQTELPLSGLSAPGAFDAEQVERLRAIRARLAAALSEG